MKIQEERIWILLARKFSDSITEAEDAELKNLLPHHPDAQYTFEILRKIWKTPPNRSVEDTNLYLNDFNGQDEEVQVAEAVGEMPATSRHFHFNRRIINHLMVAAGILLIIGSFFYVSLYKFSERSKKDINHIYTVRTKAGEKKNITLPDGTRVWLNVASSLSYPARFTHDSIRQVTLTGEAYFEVKHDKKHPFIIHIKNMDIRDIGTAFNVKSYPGEASTETTLISGVIEVVVHNNMEKKIRLKPKEKIVVYQNMHVEKYRIDSLEKDTRIQDIHITGYKIIPIKRDPKIQTFPETAWMQNDLVFMDQVFEELAKAMERKYAVKIIITDSRVKQYRLTGIFRNETIGQALEELQGIASFKYTMKDSLVTIY